ncbi:MAG: PAS domain-containing sensor histidine kinase [Opitutaceae bacterium]
MTAPAIPFAVERGVFHEESRVARRFRATDWSRTALGPPDTWPESLRVIVALCLVSELPVVVWWGENKAMFHNDQFTHLLGGRAWHLPASRDREPATGGWNLVAPLLEQVYATGQAVAAEEICFSTTSDSEDAGNHSRLSLTPILARDGSRVDGVLGVVTASDSVSKPASLDAVESARLAKKFRRAMEIETVGIIFFDTSGSITDANDAFLQMSGYTREDLRNGLVRWDAMTPPEWMPHSLRAVAEFKALGRTIPYEREYLRKDGSRWWALFSATRLDDDEGVEFIIDITKRKAADEELRRHRNHLEIRVQERTAALDAVNGALRDEIIERQRAEASRQELQRQLASAQEDERRRISRELHDEIGQHLTALMLGLKSLETISGEPPAQATLASLQTITETVGKRIHDLALELRPTALDDLGLLRTLSNYIEQWSATSKIEVDFHSTGWANDRLPPSIETAAYRIVQEALTNVLKHADASRVSIIVERRPEQVTLIIEDDGKGFDPDTIPRYPQSKRLGLLGMEERAALMDGEVKLESAPGQGTTVFVRIPLPVSTAAKTHG